MIEPDLTGLGHRSRADAPYPGDQVGVEAGFAGVSRDVDEVAPRAGLAAGKMHMQHAERRGFGKHPRPSGGVEFAVARLEPKRGGAIRATERAPMRQLGEELRLLR